MDFRDIKFVLEKLKIPRQYSQAILDELSTRNEDAVSQITIMNDTPLQSASLDTVQPLHFDTERSKPDEEQPNAPGEQDALLGDYVDLGLLGEGGMGSVRLVRDRQFNRRLAMKIIHPKLLGHTGASSRFVEEAQVCAQLQHPNIVPIYDMGTLSDGRFYFTMKEIKGRSLGSVIKSVHAAVKNHQFTTTADGWNFHRLINVFYEVCQAVAYAHSKGVLHRDLKPENIMLGEFAEVLVVDWGIAKILNKDALSFATYESDPIPDKPPGTHFTQIGQAVGTPAYMSPEQALGDLEQISYQTDIYSLGAILYQILCNSPPYTGPSAEDVLRQLKSGPPVTVETRLDGEQGNTTYEINFDGPFEFLDIPQDLINICNIAMSREIEERYSSVDLLSAEILTWLEGSKKREKALEMVNEAKKINIRYEELKREGRQLIDAARESLDQLPAWAGEDVKGVHWSKEKSGQAKLMESTRMKLAVEHMLQSALSHKPDLVEGHAALLNHYLGNHREAELLKDEGAEVYNQFYLRQHAESLPKYNTDRNQALHYLKGTGAVSLTTDTDGVDIYLDEYVPHHRRLVPKRIAHLGNRGLKEYPLEMGSYRIVLKKSGYHDVTYPVHVGRGEHCDGRDENGFQRPVHVPKQGELRSDECFVPGGWFLCGGDSEAENSYSLRRVWLDDFVMSRFPVTNRAYLMFLNSLLSDGREADALKWVPRETAGASENNGSALYARDDDGQFVLPPGNEIEKWELDWPVCMVSGHCAQAYCNWLSGYAALPYRLPSELEWTKSARGVDGRRYVWGNEIDPSYACLGVSHQGRRLPSVVDSYPVDESVYGIRGLSGNMMDWTSSGFRADWKDLSNDSVRVYLGGAWLNYAKSARVSQRLYGNHAGQSRIIGFRVCRSI